MEMLCRDLKTVGTYLARTISYGPARRPDGSGNSLMQENPSDRNSLAVPRATASAVSDWRRSGAGTRLIWRAGDSIL